MNARDKGGATPLFVACESGHATCAKLLLHAGADVLLRNSAGEAPLYIAALRGELLVVDALLHHMHEQGICWQVTPPPPFLLPTPSPAIPSLLPLPTGLSYAVASTMCCASLCMGSSAVWICLVYPSVLHFAHSFRYTCLFRLWYRRMP